MNERQKELVRGWEVSRKVAKNIAADLAIGIDAGRIRDVPDTGDITGEWIVSPRTAQSAKKLLGDAGILKKDKTRRYYIP
jgi:hypothetical protein